MPDRTTWEYATAPLLIHATQEILNHWGSQGWELVQVIPGPIPEQLVVYFKRPSNRRRRAMPHGPKTHH